MAKPLNKPAKTWLQEDLQSLRLSHPPKNHRGLAEAVLQEWRPGPNATLRGGPGKRRLHTNDSATGCEVTNDF